MLAQNFLCFDDKKIHNSKRLLSEVIEVKSITRKQINLRLSQQEYKIPRRIAEIYEISVTTFITSII
jgi:hypothetical protein